MKIEIIKTRDYRDGIGRLEKGKILDLNDTLAKQLVDQGCAKDLSGTIPPKTRRVKMVEETDAKKAGE